MTVREAKSNNAATAETDAKKKPKKKKSNLRFYIGIPVFLIVAVILFGMMPLLGTIQFGICRVFVEKRYTYPQTLDIISVLERPSDVRIEYTIMNEFGDTMFHTITCAFKPDPVTTIALAGAVLDRHKMDAAEIDAFNRTLPAVLAYPPDLRIPMPMTDDLMNLWKESGR